MTPDELKNLTGIIVIAGFLALLSQMYWQVRVGLVDRQRWSAFFFVLMTTLVVGQLMLSYLGGPSFGNTARGPVFFLLWVASVVWWTFCTFRHNAHALRKIREAERKQLDAMRQIRKH